MDMKEIGVNTRNWIASARDWVVCRDLAKQDGLPGSIGHGVIYETSILERGLVKSKEER